jgi:hypothetical protein
VTVRNAGKGALKWSVVAPSTSWFSVSPQKGTNTGTLTLTFRTSAVGRVLWDLIPRRQRRGIGYRSCGSECVAAAVPRLAVSCPSNVSVASSDGKAVAVPYNVSTSGGVAPVTMSGNLHRVAHSRLQQHQLA